MDAKTAKHAIRLAVDEDPAFRTALEGAETAVLARERGITTADARTRAARAAARFDAALRETLAEEGIAPDAIDDELAWLMEAALR